MNIFVGNLPYRATEEDLRRAFKTYGRVASVKIIKDPLSDQSRGFGFVEMPIEAEAMAAIKGMNNQAFHGRTLRVDRTRPR